MDKLQTRIRAQILELMADEDLTDFNLAVKQADKLAADLATAKSKGKGVFNADLAYNKAVLHLWSLEKRILVSLVAGITQATKPQIKEIDKLVREKQQLHRDYLDQRIIEIKGTKEEKQARAIKNKELKDKYIKAAKALDIKELKAGTLQDLQRQRTQVELSLRALSTRSSQRWDIEPIKSDHPAARSPLDQVDILDLTMRDHAKLMEAEYEG